MAGVFGFLRSFGKEKLGQVGETLTQKIVSWDPETASQAEIEEMIKELDKITTEAGKAKAAYEKEKAESEAAHKNYDRYLAAAELINKQSETAQASGDQSKSQELKVSLEKLLQDLEKLQPEVERETREADEALTYYDEVKELAKVTAEKVKSAKTTLEQAKRDMQRAEVERQRSQARAEKAENLAGLKKQSSSLGVALAAMNKQAEDARASASASDIKAKLLSPEQEKQDENIKAALKEVSGESPAQTASISDRLAALKKK
jgi:DNA repair exonuclease SbcCD ATPase subunit